jgi:hypothetical protein
MINAPASVVTSEPPIEIRIFCVAHFDSVPPKMTDETSVGTMKPSHTANASMYHGVSGNADIKYAIAPADIIVTTI